MRNGSILGNGKFHCPYCDYQEDPNDGVSHLCSRCGYSSWILGRQGTVEDLNDAYLTGKTPPPPSKGVNATFRGPNSEVMAARFLRELWKKPEEEN